MFTWFQDREAEDEEMATTEIDTSIKLQPEKVRFLVSINLLYVLSTLISGFFFFLVLEYLKDGYYFPDSYPPPHTHKFHVPQ
jgi:hypothetical protein